MYRQLQLYASVATATLLGALPAVAAAGGQSDFNDRDNIVIADQFNNRVVEIEPSTHRIVWQFGNGSDVPGPNSVVGTNDAERFGPYTLISGTGIPPSSPPNVLPGCSTPATGCPDNRVFIVDPAGKIVWRYGTGGVTGAGPNQLNTPVDSVFVSGFPRNPGFHVMITDQANQRVIVVNLFTKSIDWQYGTTGVPGTGPDQLNNPNSAAVLENGHILIADENNNRVIEVNVDKQIVKSFTGSGTVSGAAFASRLQNGNTLITDSNNNRIIEVNPSDVIVWQYRTNLQKGSNANPLPTRAVRLRNGNTLISDQFNNRVIEVTHAGQIVFQQGALNVVGSGFDLLNGPYDAKIVGDYTGLTPPFDLDQDGDDR
jgi:NHL repeat/PQQ enzyme repeat